MIPLYGAMAHGGKIISLDDPSVVKDGAALNGSGGSAYAPYIVPAPIGAGGGWATLRRADLRVAHDGAVTVTVTPRKDGQDTGNIITRVLSVSDQPEVEVPFFEGGSEFHMTIALSAFTAPAALGPATIWVVPRRTNR